MYISPLPRSAEDRKSMHEICAMPSFIGSLLPWKNRFSGNDMSCGSDANSMAIWISDEAVASMGNVIFACHLYGVGTLGRASKKKIGASIAFRTCVVCCRRAAKTGCGGQASDKSLKFEKNLRQTLTSRFHDNENSIPEAT